jgi:CubicO group peptidase (beta-lactamase class C family)
VRDHHGASEVHPDIGGDGVDAGQLRGRLRTILSRMGDARDGIAALIGAAGFERDEPVLVGVLRRDEAPWFVAQGLTRGGEPVSGTTLVYTASLSKQLVAAGAAVLVRGGGLDLDSALSRWLPELPGWADTVRLRHLVYHTSGLRMTRSTPPWLRPVAPITPASGCSTRCPGCRP